MLFNAGGTCGDDIQFNQNQTLTGFAWGVVYDVNTQGSNKNIRMKVDFTNLYMVGTQPGPLPSNILYNAPPILVQ